MHWCGDSRCYQFLSVVDVYVREVSRTDKWNLREFGKSRKVGIIVNIVEFCCKAANVLLICLVT